MLTLAQAADMTGALAAYKLALAQERIAELKGRLEEFRQERDRARAGEAAWKAQGEAVTRQIALPAPPPHPDTQPSRFRRASRWIRATAYLSGAGLLLALSALPAAAQQQQPTATAAGMLHGGDEPQHPGQSSGVHSARPLHRQDVAVALHKERHCRLCILATLQHGGDS